MNILMRVPDPDISWALYVFLLSLCWMVSSVVGTIANKHIMRVFPFPVILTVFHLLLGMAMDALVVRRNVGRLHVRFDLVKSCVPIALALSSAKILTYISYGNVPVSLTHTVKSSSPIFAVIISKTIHPNAQISLPTLLTLVPIVVGVTLSAISEIEFHVLGFLSALVSSLTGVFQTTLTKRIFDKTDCDPIFLHFHTSLVAILMMLPIAAVFEGRSFLFLGETMDPLIAHSNTSIPFTFLFVSILSHYLQTISSTLVLSQLSVTSHQVFSTLKRLIVIVASIAYFGNHVSIFNWVGIVLALSGFFLYGMQQLKQSHRSTRVWDSTFRSDQKHKGILPMYQQKAVHVALTPSLFGNHLIRSRHTASPVNPRR